MNVMSENQQTFLGRGARAIHVLSIQSTSRRLPPYYTQFFLICCLSLSSLPVMPRATSQKISAAHTPSAKGKERESGDVGGRNPLFNTERFGQHILKNPAVAQAYIYSVLIIS